MNRIFEPRGFFTVPDGTHVSAFLNASDITQDDVPWGALGEMSVAAGHIGPKVHSWVHVLPAVTQVTYVLSGSLNVRMKDSSASEHYDLALQAGKAVVTQPGTLFQLRNDSETATDVLYIVSPTYVFEKETSEVKHDDAILVARTWEEVAAANYDLPALNVGYYEASALRVEALRRVGVRKGVIAPSLAAEQVCSVKAEYDYLAPDGSEIRLLVAGEHGSLAHRILPAGKASAPVQHRTVEELWYVLEGSGEVWRGRDGQAHRRDTIRVGDSIRIPVGAAFQFRAGDDGDLKLLLTTMPPWPGPQEAVQVPGAFDKPSSGGPS
jgi:mannose-6-phosphate isomerase-like protein (cupin superfamily)